MYETTKIPVLRVEVLLWSIYGAKYGSRNWNKRELTSLLDMLEELLPIGPREWDVVPGRLFMIDNNWRRSTEACNVKFGGLWYHKPHTGTSTPSMYVLRARFIKQKWMSWKTLVHSLKKYRF